MRFNSQTNFAVLIFYPIFSKNFVVFSANIPTGENLKFRALPNFSGLDKILIKETIADVLAKKS